MKIRAPSFATLSVLPALLTRATIEATWSAIPGFRLISSWESVTDDFTIPAKLEGKRSKADHALSGGPEAQRVALLLHALQDALPDGCQMTPSEWTAPPNLICQPIQCHELVTSTPIPSERRWDEVFKFAAP